MSTRHNLRTVDIQDIHNPCKIHRIGFAGTKTLYKQLIVIGEAPTPKPLPSGRYVQLGEVDLEGYDFRVSSRSLADTDDWIDITGDYNFGYHKYVVDAQLIAPV